MDVSGAYWSVSENIKVVRILRYSSWSIVCVSHANRTRTRIEYVSDTRYVAILPNPGNTDYIYLIKEHNIHEEITEN
jgi:hypothetical protein